MKRLDRFKDYLKLVELAQRAGKEHEPQVQRLLRRVLSDLEDGAVSRAAIVELKAYLEKQVILAMVEQAEGRRPYVEPGKGLSLGVDILSGKSVDVEMNVLVGGIFISGSDYEEINLYGKMLVQQLLAKNVQVQVETISSAWRSFAAERIDSIVVNPANEPLNALTILGTSGQNLYILLNEVKRLCNLHQSTVNQAARLLAAFLIAYPDGSLRQFTNYLHAVALERSEAKYATLAAAFENLCAQYGRMSTVKRGADLEDNYRLIVRENGHVITRFNQFLSSIREWGRQFYRLENHSNDIVHEALVCDGHMFFRELSENKGSGTVSPWKRTMLNAAERRTCVMALIRQASEIDEVIKSQARTFVILHTGNPKDVKAHQRLLDLEDEGLPLITTLRRGDAIVKSEGYSQGFKVRWKGPDQKAPLSDAELAKAQEGKFHWIESHTVYATPEELQDLTIVPKAAPTCGSTKKSATATATPPAPPALLEDYFSLLRAIGANQGRPCGVYYKAMGFSVGKASRIKEDLLSQGLIMSEQIRGAKGGRPAECLKLTPKGEEALRENK